MDADEANRVRLGASKTTSPEILRSLATDPSVTVRASLALNPALPEQVIAILEADTDARVRAIIGRKLAPLTATVPDETRQRVQKDAVAHLTAMVADAALRVRVSIAEAVRDMPEGPRDIVLRLA
jgi:adenylate kinase